VPQGPVRDEDLYVARTTVADPADDVLPEPRRHAADTALVTSCARKIEVAV